MPSAIAPSSAPSAPGIAPVLDTDVVTRRAQAHDASHYLLVPRAVTAPESEAQVIALLARAHRDGTAVTFRAGGTSLAGQSQSDQVLADVRRHFRDVEVLDGGSRVKVGPGATLRQVNARLARHGRRLGPDPASEVACTIGGVIANNSSGMAAGIEENSYRTLESLRFVLPSGTVVDTADPRADARLREAEPALHEGLLRLMRQVREEPQLRRIIAERFAMKNTMGYGINALLDFEDPADVLAHLVIGSEGTLAFVSSAVFRTVPVQNHVATGLLTAPSLQAATAMLPGVVEAGFATVELLDASSLLTAQRLAGAPREIAALTVQDHAALLVEQRADTPEELAAKVADGSRLAETLSLSAPFEMTTDAVRRAALWTTRKGLYAAVAGDRPAGSTALLEDVVVPVPALEATCVGLQEMFERHGYAESVIFGHAKDGNIHFLLNEQLGEGSARFEAFTEDMVELVLGHGGNLKAEHGTGRAMAPFVERQYGPELYQVMRRIKQLVDPAGILNPGVVLTDDHAAHLRDLKPTVAIEQEADRCVECGYCEPVCPSKDLTLTPRQRIVLRREEQLARQRGDEATAAAIAKTYDYQGLQTCAVDGMCVTTCPVAINTGDLVRRLRSEEAGAVARAGWDQASQHWGALTQVASAGISVAGAMPRALPRAATGIARSVISTDVMLDYRPELPRRGGSVRRGGLIGAADHGGVDQGEADVVAVFMPACVHTMFGAAEGPGAGCGGDCGCTDAGTAQKHRGSGRGIGATEALTRLAERAGVALLVPEDAASLCCGTPFSSKGMTKAKDRMRTRLRESLLVATDQGRLPVVVDAMSCTEGVQVALEGSGIEVIDAITLVRRTMLDRLTVTSPAQSVTIHPTCSTTHLGATDDLVALARACVLDPEDVVVPVAWGCCAYAGDRGMLHPELTASATAAEAAEVAARPTQWYVSTNRTCELGMQAATGKAYRHVLELLASATR